jgi:hypothetical protein
MYEHSSAALYRRVMEGMGEGDMSAFEAVLSDDVVWWQIGSPEPMRGKEAVLESMKGVDFEVDLGLVTARVRIGDNALTYRMAEIAHVEAGKVTERWAFSDDTQAIIDFFSRLE